VVLTILKNISQWEGLSHDYGQKKNVPNHQPVWACLRIVDPIFQWIIMPHVAHEKKLFVGISTIFKQTHEQYPDVMLCAFAKMGMHDINYILSGYE